MAKFSNIRKALGDIGQRFPLPSRLRRRKTFRQPGAGLVLKREGESRRLRLNPIRSQAPRNLAVEIVTLATLVLTGYLVFFSPVFKADDFEIIGNHLVGDEKILAAAFPDGFNGINMLTMPEKEIRENILEKILQIEQVHFKKNLIDHQLVFDVVERDTAIIWQTNNERFLVNRVGIVYDSAPLDSPLVVVEDLKNVPVEFGQRIVTQTFVEFVSAVIANLPRQTGLSIRRVTVPETTFEIEIETTAGWKIIMDTTRSWENQLSNLVRTLDTVPNDQESRLQYIDLRIPDRIYYR